MILYIAKYVKSVNFKEAHIAKHLLHLTKTFVVKLLQIVVSDVIPKRVLARLLLIDLTNTGAHYPVLPYQLYP